MNILISNCLIFFHFEDLQSQFVHGLFSFKDKKIPVNFDLFLRDLIDDEWALHHFALALAQLETLLGFFVKTAVALLQVNWLV